MLLLKYSTKSTCYQTHAHGAFCIYSQRQPTHVCHSIWASILSVTAWFMSTSEQRPVPDTSLHQSAPAHRKPGPAGHTSLRQTYAHVVDRWNLDKLMPCFPEGLMCQELWVVVDQRRSRDKVKHIRRRIRGPHRTNFDTDGAESVGLIFQVNTTSTT